MISTNTLTIYEANGKIVEDKKYPARCEIRSHLQLGDLVSLQLGQLTVYLRADQLIAAVKNATNIPR